MTKFELCTCNHCGYKFKMPVMEELRTRGVELGTFDVASWSFCMVKCLTAATGLTDDLSFFDKIKRPFFRWYECWKYSRLQGEVRQ